MPDNRKQQLITIIGDYLEREPSNQDIETLASQVLHTTSHGALVMSQIDNLDQLPNR